jgi:hypothetical protein
MGRKTISPFVYEGAIEYYLRIPLTKPKGFPKDSYDPQYFYTEYLPKDEYSLRQVLARRLEKVIEFEKSGKRKTYSGQTRLCCSDKFIKEEAEGKYEKFNNM